MNTTQLIGRWSMDGARGDLVSEFGSAVDILAMVAGRTSAPPPSESPSADDLLIKPAGEDEWRPLLAA